MQKILLWRVINPSWLLIFGSMLTILTTEMLALNTLKQYVDLLTGILSKQTLRLKKWELNYDSSHINIKFDN